jgi:integrase
MTWEQVDLDKGTWRIPHTKGGFPQTVFLCPFLVDLLRKEERVSKFVFWANSASGHIVEPRSTLNRVTEKLEIPHISIHGLRHTFSNQAKEAFVSDVVIKILMGHSLDGSSNMQEVYINPEDQFVKKMANRVASHILDKIEVNVEAK